MTLFRFKCLIRACLTSPPIASVGIALSPVAIISEQLFFVRLLQGTFSVYERYRAVHDYVAENLEFVLPFVLYAAGGGSQRLEMSDYDSSLADLGLVPSAVLTFAWHPEVAAEVSEQMGPNPTFLKPDICALAARRPN